MKRKIKCIICKEPGKLEIKEIQRPEITQERVIIKIRRIGICGTDLHAYKGIQPFFSYPRILGHELAGEIVELEEDLPGFKIGDRVTFIPYYPCGKCIACRKGKPNCCVHIKGAGVHIDGGMIEYMSVPRDSLIQGRNLSFEELALVEPLAIGAHAVRLAAVESGEFVLVTGAGPIGIGIMEILKIAGAKVIAMDISKERLDFCSKITDIDNIINASEPPDEQIKEITRGDWPTKVFDATGNADAIMGGFEYLAHGGKYVLVGIQKGDICFNHPSFHKRETTLMSSRNATREDFEHVINSMKGGLIKAQSYITHRIPFDDAVNAFDTLTKPGSGVFKAILEL
ncbi:MAG: zinc-binding alcohol dehydrogenase family protein [Bacteroidales bacterium]|nr:MAG: zinc-binding alcohol dehydrogenase family protein [Bacteroidales bacterium]